MKKLLTFIFVLSSLSFVSCGNDNIPVTNYNTISSESSVVSETEIVTEITTEPSAEENAVTEELAVSTEEVTEAITENQAESVTEEQHTEDDREKVKRILIEFYNSMCKGAGLKVCLADVTHDGFDDMILVYGDDTRYTANVVTVDFDDNDTAKIIMTYEAANSHAQGYFNLFLFRDGDYCNLGIGSNGMFQGTGSLDFYEFFLTENKENILLDSNTIKEYTEVVSHISTGNRGPENPCDDDTISSFYSAASEKIASSYEIFCCDNFDYGHGNYIDTNPEIVFSN